MILLIALMLSEQLKPLVAEPCPNVSAGCDDICTFTIVENDGHP